MERIALIGLGPHARRIYYPYLEDLIAKDDNFSFELIIDLGSNRQDIDDFVRSKTLKPNNILFLDSKNQISPTKIDQKALDALQKHGITKAIVSTEPKAHKIYLEACIKLGIPVIVDKPITAPRGLTPTGYRKVVPRINKAKRVYKDVVELQKMIEKSPGSRVLVQCQRRNHKGYAILQELAADIVNKYNIPITYIDIHHSDGMWNMPNEFISRENHPYKYGYGKLMHSGYHFIDLLTNLIQINSGLDTKYPDKIEIFTQATRPADQHLTISEREYSSFFGADKAMSLKSSMLDKSIKGYGEIDTFSQIRITKKDRVVTTAQLSLMQSGFSQRAWSEMPKDSYKSNGRVRHERVSIHIGPLCSIQVHSYQSTEIAAQKGQKSGIGDKNHFDIYVFRNTKLIGGKPFEHIKFGAQDTARNDGDKYLGHNEEARHKSLNELMYDLPSNSELKQHLVTNRFISALYKNQAKQVSGIIPYSKYKFKDIF